MTFVCSNCPLQLIGPPSLDGTPCPECSDGELAAVDVVFSNEVSFESFECADARRSIIRENEAHMLAQIRAEAAPSFITGGRP